jgi:hypothetical protein
MSPDEIDQYLLQVPMPPLRLTLASGDQIVLRQEDYPFTSGLTLVIRGSPNGDRMVDHSRLVSIPNIVLVEPLGSLPPNPSRRRRK